MSVVKDPDLKWKLEPSSGVIVDSVMISPMKELNLNLSNGSLCTTTHLSTPGHRYSKEVISYRRIL